MYPLHVFYLTSCPLENSLDRPFSVIQSASVAFWILHWNSPVHPHTHPTLPHTTSMLEDSLCQLCLSYHSPLEYSLLSLCHSLLCFSYSLPLYLNLWLTHTHTHKVVHRAVISVLGLTPRAKTLFYLSITGSKHLANVDFFFLNG